MTRSDFRGPGRWALAAGAAATLAALAPAASAQGLECSNEDTFPCGDVQVEDQKLQPVPSVFKFQARISQAKLPVGKGTFPQVVVRLLEGDTPVCKEKFQDVEVRDSVLNLEIGRNMSCELDAKIASGNSLAFQVCLGSEDSCLKPVELATVPYAVKSSYSHMAQQAHQADEAATSHYAFRAAADRDLDLLDEVSTGYFDFQTPKGSGNPQTHGYLQWTPVADPAVHKLHVTGREAGSDATTKLDELELDSAKTTASGSVFVAGSQTVAGDVTSEGHLTVMGEADVEQSATLHDTLEVASTATLQGGLRVTSQGAEIAGGGLSVTGATTFEDGTTTHGPATFQDVVEARGGVRATERIAMRPGQASGSQSFAAVRMEEDGLVIGPRAPSGDRIEVPSVEMDGPLSVNDEMNVSGRATFDGTAVFEGTVDLRSAEDIQGLQTGGGGGSGGASTGNWSFQGSSVSHDGQTVLQGDSGTNDLTAAGDIVVEGATVATGGLTVKSEANLDAPTTLRGPATLQDRLDLQYADGTTPSAFLSPREDGTVHVDDNRKLSGLVVEADTRFPATTEVQMDGGLAANGAVEVQDRLTTHDWQYWGDGLRLRGGDGLQRDVSGQWTSALSFPGGDTLALDPQGALPGGTKVGGGLEVQGGVRSRSGLVVQQGGAKRLAVDGTQTHIFDTARVDGQLRVEGGAEIGGGTTQVNGELQVNGGATVSGGANVSGGLRGSGRLRLQHTDCETIEVHAGSGDAARCPQGKWVRDVEVDADDLLYFDDEVRLECCAMALSQ